MVVGLGGEWGGWVDWKSCCGEDNGFCRDFFCQFFKNSLQRNNKFI